MIHNGFYIKNTFKILKCGAGEGWISWSDRVKNEVLQKVDAGSILHTIKNKEGQQNWSQLA